MKKVFAIFAIAGMLVACGSDDAKKAEDAKESTEKMMDNAADTVNKMMDNAADTLKSKM